MMKAFLEKIIKHTLFKSTKKASLLLAAFALLSVSLLSTIHLLTKDKIAENEKIALLRGLNALVPQNRYDNDLLSTKRKISSNEVGTLRDVIIYLARKKEKPVAAIFEVINPKGYGGEIRLLVGINHDKKQTIAGVRIVTHKETPGLGDDIDIRKSDWILDFNGKSLQNPNEARWSVKKDGGDFDQFTGATITPRAVVASVRQILLYARTHLEAQFKLAVIDP